jgi:D-glycero-D-manno-heptose 1,7-bisphosphate phosphatase
VQAAVFLDRDGVLNRARVVDGVPRAAATLDELEILDEAREGCEELRAAGFLLICVTNQPEIARGGVDPAQVEAINDRLAAELRLDEVVVCPHDDADDCDCRKPKPGMLLDAALRHDIDLARSFTVGDRWRDVEAGRAAGTRVVFVDHGYDEELRSEPDVVVANLADAAEWISAVRGT